MDSGPLTALAPNVTLVGVWLAAILTLMVYSHLLNDNPLSRVAEHLFVGTAAGYAMVLAYYNVIWPKLIQPLQADWQANYLLLIPAGLAVMLLVRPVPYLRALASLPLGLIVGVGAALAVAGAIAGSLLPQVSATMLSLDPSQPLEILANNILIVVGVCCTILYFFFTAKPGSLAATALSLPRAVGKWAMIVAFGAIFAATVTARLSLLVGRAQFILGDWLGLLK